MTEVIDRHVWDGNILGEGTEGHTARLRAFVTNGEVLGRNCDGRTYFGMERGMENLDGNGKSRNTNTLNPCCYLN